MAQHDCKRGLEMHPSYLFISVYVCVYIYTCMYMHTYREIKRYNFGILLEHKGGKVRKVQDLGNLNCESKTSMIT